MLTKASDLNKASENFDPAEALGPYSHFYVQRESSPLHRIKTTLLSKVQSPKILFSGHRGSGKSTELNRLLMYPEISQKYFVVKYSVGGFLSPVGLYYTDLLVSIGNQIFAKARDYGKLKQEKWLIDGLDRWRGATEIEESIENNTEIEVVADVRSLQVGVKKKRVNKENIHKIIEARLPEIIDIINTTIQRVVDAINKPVLVIIDDLDKVKDTEAADKLFYEHQTSIIQPKCAIIYTVPISVYYSQDAKQMMQPFIDGGVLPNIAIMKNGVTRDPDEDGYKMMKQFVQKRMSHELIEKDALNHAVSISGGVFREMARIIRGAILNAIVRGVGKVQKCDVEKIEVEIRNDFRRMLKIEDYDELRNVHETQYFTKSETRAKLLHNLSVLEYANPTVWYDVHPTIVPLLEERN